ncbi:PqiC family protein (plasmid) [Roseobacteraceae bacterium NS-SX3]
MLLRPFALACSFLALVACGGEPARFATPEAAPAEQIRVSYRSIELREVSLPLYAAAEEIAVADAAGQVQAARGSLWADDPVRSVTLALVRALSGITGARTASEPWPFASPPDVAVEVRFEEFLAGESGLFTARGMYFVAPAALGRAERARSFTITKSFSPEGGFPAIAAARAAIISELAEQIVKSGLR